MSYKTSNAEGHVDFINTYDLEPMAQQVIPKAAFGYIASGAEDTFTLRENIRAFNHKLIVPHTLCDVENPSTEIELQVKNYLHQLLWHLLRLINWQMSRGK